MNTLFRNKIIRNSLLSSFSSDLGQTILNNSYLIFFMFRQKQMYKSHEKSKLFNDEMKPGIKRYDPSEGTSEKSNPTDFSRFSQKCHETHFAIKKVKPQMNAKHDLPGFALNFGDRAHSVLRATCLFRPNISRDLPLCVKRCVAVGRLERIDQERIRLSI